MLPTRSYKLGCSLIQNASLASMCQPSGRISSKNLLSSDDSSLSLKLVD